MGSVELGVSCVPIETEEESPYIEVPPEEYCFTPELTVPLFERFFLFMRVLLTIPICELDADIMKLEPELLPILLVAVCDWVSSFKINVVGGRSGCTFLWCVSTISEYPLIVFCVVALRHIDEPSTLVAIFWDRLSFSSSIMRLTISSRSSMNLVSSSRLLPACLVNTLSLG